MRLGKNQLVDLIISLDIAIDSERSFAQGHVKPFTDETMDGYAGVVNDTYSRIRRFEKLREKLAEELRRVLK